MRHQGNQSKLCSSNRMPIAIMRNGPTGLPLLNVSSGSSRTCPAALALAVRYASIGMYTHSAATQRAIHSQNEQEEKNGQVNHALAVLLVVKRAQPRQKSQKERQRRIRP